MKRWSEKMTYKQIVTDFWRDDAGIVWEIVDTNVSDWSFGLQKVNYPEVRIRVHGSKFESVRKWTN